jgi:hypothetical protein
MRFPFARTIIAILHVALCVTTATLADDDKKIEDLVLELLRQRGSTADLSVIKPANNAAVVSLLRDVATQKRRRIGPALPCSRSANIILLRLGDPKTMQRNADAFMKTGNGFIYYDIASSRQAAIIPYLADGLFIEDTPASLTRGRGCTPGITLAWRATYPIFDLLSGSPQFTDEVRGWAKNEAKGSLPARRAALRIWWKQNEAIFKSGDYKAVRPLVPQPSNLTN